MNKYESFAYRRPVLFALSSMVAWFVLALIFSGVASTTLGRPYGDPTTLTIGRLAVAACCVLVLWRLQWLRVSGVTGLGTWPVWLIAVGGTIYAAAVSLFAFFGTAGLGFSSLLRHPAFAATIAVPFAAALSEEILFRGLVLYALVRVWGKSRWGSTGAAAVTSLLFAVLHLTQVFTYGVVLTSALLLTAQTFIIAIWWAALTLRSGSIWPAFVAHFVVNAVVALQRLRMPIIENDPSAYARVVAFSLLLGVLGIGMLARASSSGGGRRNTTD